MLGKTEVQALRGMSFSIDKGEFAAIAGPSGSGKTTILNMVGCVDIPTDGDVFVDGEDVAKLGDRAITRFRLNKIGFIFQSFNIIPVLNVYENFIEEEGLKDRVRNKPAELSGGQRQRVAIARALVTKPVIVLADEPTANLDSETGHRIVDLMKEINRNEKTTFIFSTHDRHIMEHAGRVIGIRDGQLADSQ